MRISSRTIGLLISLGFLAAMVYFFTNIVTYVLIAWVLSLIGDPFMNFFLKYIKFGKFRIGPAAAAVLTILTFFLIMAALIAVFLPPIIQQLNNFARVDYAEVASTLETPFLKAEAWMHEMNILTPQEDLATLLEDNLKSWFKPAAFGTILTQVISAFGSILIGLASVIFILFFFLKERGIFFNFMVALVPEEYEQQTRNALSNISTLLSRYFGGLVLQMAIFATVVSVCLKILGIPNALLIGFIAAFLNIIPYIGPIIGAVFGILLTISSGLDLDFYLQLLPMLIKVAGVFAFAQLIDNYFVQPYIFSTSVLAHPLEIFIVVLMGGKIYGILGMVLAIPGYTVLRAIAREFLSEFNIVRHLTESIGKVENRSD